MGGLIGNFFIANFFDDGGELIETKKISFTMTRPKKKTFSWNGGEYVIPDTSYMFKFTPFPYLYTYWSCSYQINKPDPIKQQHTFQPLISAKAFHQILNNTVLEKLMSVRSGWGNIFTLRNILIFLALIGILIYFLSGGSVDQVVDSVSVGGRGSG